MADSASEVWSEPALLVCDTWLGVALPVVVVEHLHSGLVVKFQGGIGQRISYTERAERGTDAAHDDEPICHHHTADERVISVPTAARAARFYKWAGLRKSSDVSPIESVAVALNTTLLSDSGKFAEKVPFPFASVITLADPR